MLACEPKGRRFNSHSGHRPGWGAKSGPQQGLGKRQPHIDVSLPLSSSLPPSKKINVYIKSFKKTKKEKTHPQNSHESQGTPSDPSSRGEAQGWRKPAPDISVHHGAAVTRPIQCWPGADMAEGQYRKPGNEPAQLWLDGGLRPPMRGDSAPNRYSQEQWTPPRRRMKPPAPAAVLRNQTKCRTPALGRGDFKTPRRKWGSSPHWAGADSCV